MMGMGTMPRMGEAVEIAQLALFLASDEASLINGAVVTADAGWGCYLKERSRFLPSFSFIYILFDKVAGPIEAETTIDQRLAAIECQITELKAIY